MYILYGGDFTRSTLVEWVLEEGKIKYELRRIDILKAEHRSPEFLAINPAGMVPALITPEGVVLHEVAALLIYLVERHGLTDLAPRASDPDWGPFLSAVFFIAGEIQPEMKRFHFPHRFSLRAEDVARVRDHAKTGVLTRLDVFNAKLEKTGPYILGDRFSLTDFYLCFWIAYLDRQTVCRRHPSIAKLYDLVRARPSATRHLDATEAAAKAYAEMTEANPQGVIV